MPRPTDSGDDADNRIGDVTSALAANYHLLALLAVIAFMFWTRFLSRGRFLRPDGIYLGGIDSYYHWRSTMYTIQQWPNTMPYDVYTSFPTGQRVGQFGTVFDQLIATIALVVGLGDPSETTVLWVVLVMIPLMGALVAVPVYLIGSRLHGRLAGLAGAALLALFPGSFFFRSSTGQHQHHVAEVLFMAIAILAFMVALRVAEREKPVYEQVLERDVHGLRDTILTSALAGVALTIYMWMWPPGILLVGIIGVFFVVYLSIEHVAGRSPEHIAFVGVISMIVAGMLFLGTIEEISTSVTGMGYLQVVLPFGVAAGCGFMAWLSRYFDKQDIDQLVYPGAVAGCIAIALGLMWLILPDLFGTLLSNVQGRLTPIGAGITAETVQEARPPADFGQHVFREFGLAFYTALIGLVALVVGPFLGQRAQAEHGLIVIWALFLISMTTAQVRFTYYLVLPVAILNAYVIGYVIEWADVRENLESLRDIEGYQLMVLATVLMILVVPLMPPVAAATVLDVGANQAPHSDTVKWQESLEYMQTSTPVVGEWGNANDELPYYGTYERPPGDNFEYPPGAYGVISWWDYGHLITVEAERIPHSNPFQRNARSSAAFFLAEGEERGSLILDAIPTGISIQGTETTALRTAAEERTEQEQQEQLRYVMIDDSMVGGKFGAIANWDEQSRADFIETGEVELIEGDALTGDRPSDRFYETMVASLYYEQADGMEQYRLVHDSSRMSLFASVGISDGETIQPLMVNFEARSLLQNLQQIGVPVGSLQDIMLHPQLELYDIHQAPEVRTFERVEGATITGETDDAEEVAVALVLNSTTTGEQFSYTQRTSVDDDGTFALTVPYATTDDLGPADGYTDTTVEALTDEYTIQGINADGNVTSQGSAAVPELAIYEGEEITVELAAVE